MRGQHAAPRGHLNLSEDRERIMRSRGRGAWWAGRSRHSPDCKAHETPRVPNKLPARRLSRLLSWFGRTGRDATKQGRAIATRVYRGGDRAGNSRAGGLLPIIVQTTLPPLPPAPLAPPRVAGGLVDYPVSVWLPPRCWCADQFGPCLLQLVRVILHADVSGDPDTVTLAAVR